MYFHTINTRFDKHDNRKATTQRFSLFCFRFDLVKFKSYIFGMFLSISIHQEDY